MEYPYGRLYEYASPSRTVVWKRPEPVDAKRQNGDCLVSGRRVRVRGRGDRGGRAGWRRQWRGGVQHRADGLPGGAHRSVVRRADHHLHQPAHRQLRRQRHRLRGRPAVLPRHHRPRAGPPAEQPPRRGRPRRVARTPRHPRSHRHRHPSPHPPDPRDRGDARRLRDRRRSHAARGRGRRARHRRDRPRRPGHDGRAVHRRDRRAPHRRLRLRHQAHDPAPPRAARHRRGGSGVHDGGRRAGPTSRRRLPLQRAR